MSEKVLIISSVHKWNDTRIFYKEAMSLKKKYDVTLAAIADFDRKEVDGIKVIGIKAQSRLNRYKNWKELYNICKDVKPDVCHFHDPELVSLGKKIKKNLDCKVIYDVHEDYGEQILLKTWIWKPVRKLISNIFNKYEKNASNYFDGVINVTEEINDKFPDKANKCVIKNYPVSVEYVFNKEQKCISSEKNNINIVYIGAITRIRGIIETIKAVNEVDSKWNITFTIAGNVESDELLKEMNSLNTKGRVKYIGMLDQPGVRELLSKSNIGLCCLHPVGQYPYSLPLKIFEYMQFGLAIVCSNFKYWNNLVDENSGKMVNPLDVNDIKNKIEELLINYDKLTQIGEYNFRLYKEKYNWDVEEGKLLNFYEKLFS